MKYNIERISERDIDFLIMEELASSSEFLKIFLDAVKLPMGKIVEISHSETDTSEGESDIVVVVKIDGENHVLMIENKVDAIAQPDQAGRYDNRGKKKVKDKYDHYHVFIIAPKKYLEENAESKKYEHRLAYECFKEYFSFCSRPRSKFKIHLLEMAIDKQAKKGIKEISEEVTSFWAGYRDCLNNAPYNHLKTSEKNEIKGKHSTWYRFYSDIKDCKIIHKADEGIIDLSFPGWTEKIDELKNIIEEALDIRILSDANLSVEPTNKSASLRLYTKKLKVDEDYSSQENTIHECLSDICTMFKYSEAIRKSGKVKALKSKKR